MLLMSVGVASAQTGAAIGIDASAGASSTGTTQTGNANAGIDVSLQGSANSTTSVNNGANSQTGVKPAQAAPKPVPAEGSVVSSMSGGISVAASDIDGLTAEEKAAFLAKVKAHAQVKSEQDLENFAKGILLRDEKVKDIAYSDDEISVDYRGKGKLLGVLPVSYTHRVTVDTDAPAMERVKVHFPWYSFLMKKGLSGADLDTAVAANLSADLTAESMGTRVSAYAKAFVSIADALKAQHAAE